MSAVENSQQIMVPLSHDGKMSPWNYRVEEALNTLFKFSMLQMGKQAREKGCGLLGACGGETRRRTHVGLLGLSPLHGHTGESSPAKAALSALVLLVSWPDNSLLCVAAYCKMYTLELFK
jgi:hypothetical protein